MCSYHSSSAQSSLFYIYMYIKSIVCVMDSKWKWLNVEEQIAVFFFEASTTCYLNLLRSGFANEDDEEEARERRRQAREERKKMREQEEEAGTEGSTEVLDTRWSADVGTMPTWLDLQKITGVMTRI